MDAKETSAVEDFLDKAYDMMRALFSDKRHLVIKQFNVLNKKYAESDLVNECVKIYKRHRRAILKDYDAWLLGNVININCSGGCLFLSVIYNRAMKEKYFDRKSLALAFLRVICEHDEEYEKELYAVMSPALVALKKVYGSYKDEMDRSILCMSPPEGIKLKDDNSAAIEACKKGFKDADSLLDLIKINNT